MTSFAVSVGGGGGGGGGGWSAAPSQVSVTPPPAAIATWISPAASSAATQGTPSSVFRPETTVPGSPFGPAGPAGPGAPGSPFSPFAPAMFQLTAFSRRRHWVGPATWRSQPPDGCLHAWITFGSPASSASATPATTT